MESPDGRPYRLTHQTVCLQGIHFQRRTIIGLTELNLLVLRPFSHILLNAKQMRIYKVVINESFDVGFEYFDPLMKIGDREHPEDKSLQSFSLRHLKAARLVDADGLRGEVMVPLPPSLTAEMHPGHSIRVEVEFSLENPRGGIQFVLPEGEGSLEERACHIFTQESSRLWFPCLDAYSEPCTWKLEFTVDESMTAVSCGELLETTFTPDLRRKTFHYHLEAPTAAPNIGFAIGPFELYVDPAMHEVSHFCLPHLLPLLKHCAQYVHSMFEFYEEILGMPYPYGSYKQVFVDKTLDEDCTTYATLSLLSVNLLHTYVIIDQHYLTRKAMALCVANQYFGCFIAPRSWKDTWLTAGIAQYLQGVFCKKTFGNNEYRKDIQSKMDQVISYEEQYGGIVLDAFGAEDYLKGPTTDRRSFYFSPLSAATVSPLYREMYLLKSHLMIRIIEERIGQTLLLQVLNKQLALATKATELLKSEGNVAFNPASMVMSTEGFLAAIFTVTGKDIRVFVDEWVRQGGHARFHGSFVFNRKRNSVELEVRQDATMIRGVRRFVGPLVVSVQELDGTFKHTLQIEGNHAKMDITCHSRARRNKKKKIPLSTGEEVDMDLSQMDADCPVLWIRIDPDMNQFRKVEMEQPDFMWQFQLRYERDVSAQREALVQLEKFPSPQTRQALQDVIENEQCYIHVRTAAADTLKKVTNDIVAKSIGPAHLDVLIAIFRQHFGSKSCPQIVQRNDFSNLQLYCLQKALPVAVAGLRSPGGTCPPEVMSFLFDLFKYNDNRKNMFSDCYYRAALIDALGESITPSLNPVMAVTGFEAPISISPGTRAILDEIHRALNKEKLAPTYKFMVTVSCLKVIRKLQSNGHIPPNPYFFRSYAHSGQFVDVRIAAIDALVDYLRLSGNPEDMDFLLSFVVEDPDLYVRHYVARRLMENPPFTPLTHSQSPLNTPELAEKLWSLIDSELSTQNRLRCDVVDVYFSLYGIAQPLAWTDFSSLTSSLQAHGQQQEKEERRVHSKTEVKEEVITTWEDVGIDKALDKDKDHSKKRSSSPFSFSDSSLSRTSTPKPHKKKRKRDKKKKSKKHRHHARGSGGSKHPSQGLPGEDDDAAFLSAGSSD